MHDILNSGENLDYDFDDGPYFEDDDLLDLAEVPSLDVIPSKEDAKSDADEIPGNDETPDSNEVPDNINAPSNYEHVNVNLLALPFCLLSYLKFKTRCWCIRLCAKYKVQKHKKLTLLLFSRFLCGAHCVSHHCPFP